MCVLVLLAQVVDLEYCSFYSEEVGTKLSVIVIEYLGKSVKEISNRDLIVDPFLASVKSILLQYE